MILLVAFIGIMVISFQFLTSTEPVEVDKGLWQNIDDQEGALRGNKNGGVVKGPSKSDFGE